MTIKNSFTVTKSTDYYDNGEIEERFYIDNKGDTVIGNLTKEEVETIYTLIGNAIKNKKKEERE